MNLVRLILISLLELSIFQVGSAQSFFEVSPLPVNTNYADEVAGVPYDNGLLYCSNRNANVLINWMDSKDEPLFHLYYIQKKDSSNWGVPRILSKELTTHAHQGPCTVSADGNEIFFTANSKNNEIYSAHKEGSVWTSVRPFAYNNPTYKTAHPSLSSDGQRIFFASDMPGGQGGFDIYYCDRTPQGWSTPINLGTEVNTADNELYPFIQANGVLYFSSYGHQSLGGLDIFAVREINGAWGMLQHLEAPINSEYDDFAYSASDADGMDGYFSTNRRGKSIDLFSFKSSFPVFTECKEQEENDYTYIFFDPGAIDLDTSTFIYQWDLGDGHIKKGKEVEHTFADTGQYIVQLNVIDSLTGELAEKVAVYNDFFVYDVEQPYITTSDTAEAGKPLSLDAAKTWLPQVNIEDYFWIFGDGTRTSGKHVEHIYVAPGIYEVQLGITGKSKETDEDIKVCSSRRITIK